MINYLINYRLIYKKSISIRIQWIQQQNKLINSELLQQKIVITLKQYLRTCFTVSQCSGTEDKLFGLVDQEQYTPYSNVLFVLTLVVIQLELDLRLMATNICFKYKWIILVCVCQ